MIIQALEGKALPVYGDGQNVRDWLYVEDHVRALWCILQHGQVGQTYNVGGDAERTNLDVVHTLCTLLDERLPRAQGRYQDLITPVADRPGHDRRYAIDASKLMRELDWQPQENFTSGLAKTVDWYLANRSWWERVRDGRYRGERLGLLA